MPLPPLPFPDGDQPAGLGLRSCLGCALARLGELDQGVVKDGDGECLHQHRVLLRRLRSLTAAFRSVFAEADAARLRAMLAAWAHSSNALRDLDVWLLARDAQSALVPEALRGGLDSLFAGIARDRIVAHGALVQQLSSPAHQREREEFAGLVAGAGAGPDATLRLEQLAAARTWKAYRRMAGEAGAVEAATPAEAVHRVRIRCKKLRYLLDACGQFTAPEDHQRLRDQLKAVQAVLGDCNDVAQQARALLGRVQDPSMDTATHLAVGALLGALDRQQAVLRHLLLPGLNELVAPATRQRYRRLFKARKD